MHHTLSMMSKPKRATPVLTIYRAADGRRQELLSHWCHEAQAAHFNARLNLGKHFVAALPS